ncbi:unnamed protein product [Brachionus calyciflorus]|uniref:Ubiquitin-like protease family profile domain-containing protein n=1 Tax=Brachionus calyciflorus TaxID=104777 RepID=A0A814MZL2_9BILA|nr:unnamed protein product [Brachionus calyciflorus]
MKYIIIIKNDPFDKKSDQKREYTDVTISSDAEEISNKFHGSSKKYYLDKKAKGFEPPSELALRKCNSQYKQEKGVNVTSNFFLQNDENISQYACDTNQVQEAITSSAVEVQEKQKIETHVKYSFDFLTNILSVAEALKVNIRGNKMNGYIQQVSIFPSLQLSLFTEKQLEALNKTPMNNRILHFDATGSLVSVPQQYTKNLIASGYKRILNYFLLLKNYNRAIVTDTFKTKYDSAVVAEYISSQHDVISISTFLSHFKDNYEKCYPNVILKFRLVCIDYSWASIHAVLKSFNNETVIDYAHRIFKLSQDGIIESQKSYLCSCVAHTMKRFCNSIKTIVKTDSLYKYMCYLFSLLVNSLDLNTITNYFKSIAVILLSPDHNDNVKKSLKSLNDALRERSNDEKYNTSKIASKFVLKFENHEETIVDEIVKDVESTFIEPIVTVDDNDCEEAFEENNYEPGIRNDKRSDSIKLMSPFYLHFKSIENELNAKLEKMDLSKIENINPFYNTAMLTHLVEHFMPYCFNRAGFTFKDTERTRLTNGSIENFNRFLKKDAPKNLLPHAHINFNSTVLIGGAVNYIEKVSSSFVSIKRKQIDKNVKDHYEEDIHDAVESYSKKLKVEVPSNQGYQKPINVDNLIDVDNNFTQQQSNSNVKYKIKNMEISQRDLQILERKKSWINDILIETYLSLHVKSKKTFIIASTTSKYLLLDGEFKTQDQTYLINDNISSYDYLAGPILINNNHWNCFFVDIQNGNFVYLDPKVENTEYETTAFENWKQYASLIGIDKEWSILRIENISRQKGLDNYNCGIYVSQNLKNLINSNFNLCFVQKNTLAHLDVIIN